MRIQYYFHGHLVCSKSGGQSHSKSVSVTGESEHISLEQQSESSEHPFFIILYPRVHWSVFAGSGQDLGSHQFLSLPCLLETSGSPPKESLFGCVWLCRTVWNNYQSPIHRAPFFSFVMFPRCTFLCSCFDTLLHNISLKGKVFSLCLRETYVPRNYLKLY